MSLSSVACPAPSPALVAGMTPQVGWMVRDSSGLDGSRQGFKATPAHHSPLLSSPSHCLLGFLAEAAFKPKTSCGTAEPQHGRTSAAYCGEQVVEVSTGPLQAVPPSCSGWQPGERAADSPPRQMASATFCQLHGSELWWHSICTEQQSQPGSHTLTDFFPRQQGDKKQGRAWWGRCLGHTSRGVPQLAGAVPTLPAALHKGANPWWKPHPRATWL